MSAKRVLLVDHNAAFVDGLRDWLAQEPDLKVVGAIHSGLEVQAEVERSRPDLVLVDAGLPELSGFKVTRLIKSRQEPPLVALMTFHDSRAARLEAKAAGADRCIPKSDTAGLLSAIRELLTGSGRSGGSGKPFPGTLTGPTDSSRQIGPGGGAARENKEES